MALALPPPKIPDLKPENYIDLDQLGSADLKTFVDYPGMASGDHFWPRWWGCSAQGVAVDFVDTLVEVSDDSLEPEGMPVGIDNDRLRALDQGWVFYSYIMQDTTQPDDQGEESLRRFFYVGKRTSMTSALAPPQCRESHELKLDPQVLNAANSVLIVTLPYRAMQAGDKVTLTLERYFDDGVPWDPLILAKTLSEEQVGQPLQWAIQSHELLIIEDGYALMSYRIEYAAPTSPTESASQRLDIVAPTTPELPALGIKDFQGGELDPEAYRSGIILQIPPYPGIQVGDDVILYARTDSSLVQALRVDPSTIASQVLQFTLDYAWLAANNGKPLVLVYQFARVGVAGTSLPFTVTLRKPLNLPTPIVVDATAGELPDTGHIFALNFARAEVQIRVPDEAVIGADDKVQMHWEGFTSTGSHIADPSAANPKLFKIPSAAVPANMGRHVKVFYQVTVPGEAPIDSRPFDLEVRGIDGGWPTIQFVSPTLQGGRLSLASVPINGVTLRLGSWMFMAEGQRVRIKATGLLQSGGEDTALLRAGPDEVVSEDEYYADGLLAILPRAFLARLQLNQQFRVTVETSFDDGSTYRPFPYVDVNLIE